MIDTHTHIYLEEFDNDREATVARAKEAGVKHLVLPNVDISTVEPMYQLHDAHPRYTSMAMGLHPTEIKEDFNATLAQIEALLNERRFVAIGEIGIDLYWDATFREEQHEAFATQVEWAVDMDLPIIIHCRNGLDDILRVFSRFKRLPAGVFHSFGGSIDDIRRIRRYGDFFFGINGIVTFKKSQVPSILPEIGLDRILLETDSPYLAPVPFRGKRNESSYIPYIAECIAKSLGSTTEEVSLQTDANAAQLFNLQQ